MTPAERRAIVLAAMQKTPQRPRDVAALVGISTEAAVTMMKRWENRGGVVGARICGRRYYTVTAQAAVLDRMARELAPKYEAKKEANDRYRARLDGVEPDDDTEDLLPSVQTTVPAATAPRLTHCGPRSIFDLARAYGEPA